MELPGGGGVWLAPSPSPSGPTVPDRHDEHGVGTFIWPPARTSTWPPASTFSWPRTQHQEVFFLVAMTVCRHSAAGLSHRFDHRVHAIRIAAVDPIAWRSPSAPSNHTPSSDDDVSRSPLRDSMLPPI